VSGTSVLYIGCIVPKVSSGLKTTLLEGHISEDLFLLIRENWCPYI